MAIGGFLTIVKALLSEDVAFVDIEDNDPFSLLQVHRVHVVYLLLELQSAAPDYPQALGLLARRNYRATTVLMYFPEHMSNVIDQPKQTIRLQYLGYFQH